MSLRNYKRLKARNLYVPMGTWITKHAQLFEKALINAEVVKLWDKVLTMFESPDSPTDPANDIILALLKMCVPSNDATHPWLMKCSGDFAAARRLLSSLEGSAVLGASRKVQSLPFRTSHTSSCRYRSSS